MKRLEGKAFNGGVPYGQRRVGPRGRRQMVNDPREQEVIRQIVRLRDEKGLTIDQITHRLVSADVRTRAGKLWDRNRVWRAYKQATYAIRSGWPAVFPPQDVAILNVLAHSGVPMTLDAVEACLSQRVPKPYIASKLFGMARRGLVARIAEQPARYTFGRIAFTLLEERARCEMEKMRKA